MVICNHHLCYMPIEGLLGFQCWSVAKLHVHLNPTVLHVPHMFITHYLVFGVFGRIVPVAYCAFKLRMMIELTSFIGNMSAKAKYLLMLCSLFFYYKKF